MSSPSAVIGTAGSDQARRPVDVVRVGAVAAAVAVAATLLVLLIGRAAGADMVVGEPGATGQPVGVIPIVGATVTAFLLGTLVLLAVRNRDHRIWSVLATTGLVVALLSVSAPLAMASTTGTGATLGAMHVVCGLVWFVTVRRAARTRSAMAAPAAR